MENRFGFKDLLLVCLLVAVLISVWLISKQVDRQWDKLRSIEQRLAENGKDVRSIQDQLASGVAVATGTAPASTQAADDPFARLRAARAKPGYTVGGTLVDAFGNTVGRLTPLVSSDAYAGTVQGYVLESLVDRDPDTLEIRPLLSTGWEIIDQVAEHDRAVDERKKAGKTDEDIAADNSVPPATIIKFKMRPGTRFSDGTPLTADDVVFTYQFIMNPRINAIRERSYFDRIASVEKTAADEVTFTLREPYFEALELCGGMSILPRHFYSKFDPEDFNESVGLLMGSGPYRLPDPERWRPGVLVELVRNDRYWGLGGAFDRMVWRELTSDAARLAAFRNGDTELFAAMPDQYAQMKRDAALAERAQSFEYQNPIGGYRYIGWNQMKEGRPTRFADVRVRRAMTMLLDRGRMIEQLMLGYAVEASGPFNPLSKQFDPAIKPWPYDRDAALQLLKEAGFEQRDASGVLKDAAGQAFSFRLTYPSGNVNYEKQSLFMKDAFARAGIVMELDPLDWSVMIERLKKKNFDAVTLAWTAGIETDVFQMFHSTQAAADGDNATSYRSPEFDRLVEQARRTVKEEPRMELWRRVHQVLHDEQPYTFLFFPKSLVFVDKRIQNVEVVKLGLNPRVEWFRQVSQPRPAQ
jgi:peptide/nickel transport system substrate-binding protein